MRESERVCESVCKIRFCAAMGIFMKLCVCVSMCPCVYFYESVHVWVRARQRGRWTGLSAQVRLTLSGHTSGVCRPARRALSHQQH